MLIHFLWIRLIDKSYDKSNSKRDNYTVLFEASLLILLLLFKKVSRRERLVLRPIIMVQALRSNNFNFYVATSLRPKAMFLE